MRLLYYNRFVRREKPLVIYDGECGFCRRWVARWQRATKETVEYAPFQQVGSQFPEISKEAFEGSVQLIEPTGERLSGAQAVFRLMSYAPGLRWFWWIYRKVPGAAPAAEWGYRFVARHRARLGLFAPGD